MILLVTPKWKVFAMWFVAGTTAFGAALTGKNDRLVRSQLSWSRDGWWPEEVGQS